MQLRHAEYRQFLQQLRQTKSKWSVDLYLRHPKYREFLQQLRGCYPAAAIVCTVGMMNPTSFAHIERAARAFGDENVYTHKERFCRSTHPIAADHKQAGDALSALIARIKGWN